MRSLIYIEFCTIQFPYFYFTTFFRATVEFIGDSENDVEIAEVCGFSAAVANALDKLKSIAKYVCRREDGERVLEFLNLLFK
ncbi:MAG: hypothetical protein DRJ37_01765 [Thermoprotei archaeon]|nr:MAG: hypothetical protein DRJ37_01765 [Thermoprotei archaeon]